MTGQDETPELYVDVPVVSAFIDEAWRIIHATTDRAETVVLLHPAFTGLLEDPDWLPAPFRVPDATGGMGGGLGNYLLYRSPARDLTLMSLVIPAGATTPVHDHLAWGLVGLYTGAQEETVFRRVAGDVGTGKVVLDEVERRTLFPGDCYDLLPPEGDIHAVRTISTEHSVSLHLLGTDIGCTWRHRYDPAAQVAHPFRSSYSNAPCDGPDSPA